MPIPPFPFFLVGNTSPHERREIQMLNFGAPLERDIGITGISFIATFDDPCYFQNSALPWNKKPLLQTRKTFSKSFIRP